MPSRPESPNRSALSGDLWIALTAGIVATFAGIWFTSQGLVTFNDSAQYLSVASHIAQGKGVWAASPDTGSHLTVTAQLALHGRFPLASWPPGYPMLLALVMQFGLNAMQAARVVSVAGGALLGFATYLGSRRVIRLPRSVSLAVAGLSILGPNVGLLAYGPMSGRGFAYAESVFNPLVVAAVFVGIRALQRPTIRWVIPACALLASVTLLRDTGPVYGFALLCGALASRTTVRGRARREQMLVGFLFGIVGIATAGVWSIVNRLAFDATPSVRSLGWHGASVTLASTVRVLAGWYGVPWSAPVVLHTVVVTAAIVVPLSVVLRPSIRRRWWPQEPELDAALVVVATSILGSVLAVVATGMMLDRTTLPDARHLSAAQPFAYTLGAAVVHRYATAVLSRRRPRIARIATPLLLIGALVIGLPTCWQLPTARTDLLTTPLQTAALGELAHLPDNTIIVTNAPDELWLLTSRTSLVLPPARYFTTGKINTHFHHDLDLIAGLARKKPLLVATSASIPFPSVDATRELVKQHGFAQVARCGPAVTLWALPVSDVATKVKQLCDAPDPRSGSGR